jgi:hypothetical protein
LSRGIHQPAGQSNVCIKKEPIPAVDRLIHSMAPLIRRCLPGISAEFIQQIWEERLEVLEIIEHLPQTFCHQAVHEFKEHLPADWAGIIEEVNQT